MAKSATKNAASQTASSTKRTARYWLGRVLAVLGKGLLFLVMLVFLLGALAWVVVTKMFNAQQISEAVTFQLQTVFNRPVQIASLDLKFFNTVEVKGFAVLDNEVQPGLALVSAESVLIRYQLLPLFEHKLVIDEVTLNKPRFEILRSEQGVYNVPPIKMPENQQTTYVDEQTGEQLQVHIEDWSIRDGVISYKDLKSGASHAIYGLNIQFKQLQFNDWSGFELETVLRNRWGDHVSDLEIAGKGEINFANFNWEKFALREFKTRVIVSSKPVLLSANVENLRTPVFTVTADLPQFNQEDLSVFQKNLPTFSVPASTLTLKGELDEAYTHLLIKDIAVKSKDVSVSGSGTADFSASPATADFKAKTGWVNLSKLSQYYPALQRFKLSGEGMLSGSVSCQKGKCSLPLVEIGAKQLNGSFWGFEVGQANGNFTAKQNFTDLYAQITDGALQVADSKFENLQMTASYRKGDVYTYVSSGLLNSVPLKLRVLINNIKSKNRVIETNIYLKNLDPMAFIDTVMDFTEVILAIGKPHTPSPVQTGDLAWMRNFRDRLPTFMPNFSGTFYADTFSSKVLSGKKFNAEFSFKGLLPGAADLDGTLDMKLEKGVIHQMEKLAEEQQALQVTFTPFIMLHRMETSGSFKVGEVLKDVAFEEMAASVDFKKGTMIINNAFTQGPVISAAVSGWTDWVRETFELVIWTMITPSSRRGILAENLTDENGNPALAFKVSSSMLKPKLEMLRAKKTNTQIQAARKRGLRTEFTKSRDFLKGEFNAKK